MANLSEATFRGRRAPDDEASRLYAEYQGKLFRYCLGQLRSREEAEDAVQNTFLRVTTALRKGVVPEFEAPWLYKIAHNVCLSKRLGSTRRARVETPSDMEVLSDRAAAYAPDADELFGLDDALADMPPNLRRPLLMREWQGMSYAEIADSLGVSHSAVETLIFRARKHLAQSLTDSVKKGSRAVASIFNLRWLFNAFKGLGGGLGGAGLAGGTAAVIIAVGGGVAIDLATQSASASHVHRAASSKTAVAVSADRRAAVTPAGATSGTRVPASGPVSARKLGSPSAVRGSGGSGASKSASSATGSNGSAGAAGASNGASGSSSPRAGSGSRSGAGGPPVRPSKPRSKGGRPFATKPPPLPAPPVVPSLPPLGTPPVPPISVPPLAPPTLPPPPVSTPPVPLPSPPTITVPGNLVAEATGPLGAAVSYTVTATDAADGTDPVACSAASGSTFRLGHTTVSCSATDKAGSTSTASFDVLVHDTTPPSLSVPSGITVKASLAGGVKVTYTATATDLVDPAPTVSCSPASGSLFLVGTTTVTCTATDSAGNSSSKKFTVTVTL